MSSKSSIDPLFFNFFDVQPRKGDLRKIEIINAAIRCMARAGIEKTTFDAIAREAKISRSHVIYHFPEKDALIEIAIRIASGKAQEFTIERVAQASSTEKRLHAIAEAAIDFIFVHPDYAKIFLIFYGYCALHPKYRELNTQIRETGAKRMTALLKEIYPELKTDEARFKAANEIQVLILGYCLDLVTRNQNLARDEIVDSVLTKIPLIIKSHCHK